MTGCAKLDVRFRAGADSLIEEVTRLVTFSHVKDGFFALVRNDNGVPMRSLDPMGLRNRLHIEELFHFNGWIDKSAFLQVLCHCIKVEGPYAERIFERNA